MSISPISRVFENSAKKAFLADFQLKSKLLLGGIQIFLDWRGEAQQLEVDENANPHEISVAKAKAHDYLNSLKAKTFHQYQQDWVRNRRDWKVITRGKEPTEDDPRTDLIQSLFLVMPECGHLAKMMASDKPLTEGEMRVAMCDLRSRCIRDYTLLYQSGEEPVDGACPVKCCRLKIER
jgi:hypothetical protein